MGDWRWQNFFSANYVNFQGFGVSCVGLFLLLEGGRPYRIGCAVRRFGRGLPIVDLFGLLRAVLVAGRALREAAGSSVGGSEVEAIGAAYRREAQEGDGVGGVVDRGLLRRPGGSWGRQMGRCYGADRRCLAGATSPPGGELVGTLRQRRPVFGGARIVDGGVSGASRVAVRDAYRTVPQRIAGHDLVRGVRARRLRRVGGPAVRALRPRHGPAVTPPRRS